MTGTPPTALATGFPSAPRRRPGPREAPSERQEPVGALEIPGVYRRPVPPPDEARITRVDELTDAWARDEVDLYPPDWAGEFRDFQFGRSVVLCHPAAPTIEHLMAASRLLVAENAVDDMYCEDHGGGPHGLAARLLTAQSALHPTVHPPPYGAQWRTAIEAEAPLRAYRSSMVYFRRLASASQADREVHDLAKLHMGYLAEAAHRIDASAPPVWSYLVIRQMNSFRPCLSVADAIDGYEIPPQLHAHGTVQRMLALAGLATTLANDLYSYGKERDLPRFHANLPKCVAAEENVGEEEAFHRSVEIHNDVMHQLEDASATVSTLPVPHAARYAASVNSWVDGSHEWHRTNTARYHLPPFLHTS
ncbi:2-methylisoborneol synthase [Streptomyces sp. NBC_00237]|uniref:terpene synthase family protein n=1 Tax=Streptomyces sp. NBC_00237 TaxID=2975687 RepID=UPI00224C9ACA|nr:2-methylisoborneol synthase [Streptomyces sp. NBC_00237]MCX5205730.1 2-methylisoborneol synthase [Streptomyces sp. NBC_00237]